MYAPRDARSRDRRRPLLGHVLHPPGLFSEDGAACGLLLGVNPPVDDYRRRPFLGGDVGRRFTRGAVISSEFAPRCDDAVVVNHAAGSGTRCALYTSAWAAFLPPSLLLEDPSDFLPGAQNETQLVPRVKEKIKKKKKNEKRRKSKSTGQCILARV